MQQGDTKKRGCQRPSAPSTIHYSDYAQRDATEYRSPRRSWHRGASTFRKLRGLQAREIEPEDYDLLLRLHAKPTTRVLKDDLREKVCLSFRAGGDGKEWVQPADPCTICLCVMAAGEI